MEVHQLVPLLTAGVFALLGAVFLSIGLLRSRMSRYPTFRWRDQHGMEHQRTSWVYASLGPRPGTRCRSSTTPRTSLEP